MAIRRYTYKVLFLLLCALATNGAAAEPAGTATAVPAVETWNECLRSDGDFFGLTVLLCKDPTGGPHDYGAVAYNGAPEPRNFVGKLWGLKFYRKSSGYDARRIRILLRTDGGTDFISAEGARPDVQDQPDRADNAVVVTITLPGENGEVGKRTVILVPSKRARPAERLQEIQAP